MGRGGGACIAKSRYQYSMAGEDICTGTVCLEVQYEELCEVDGLWQGDELVARKDQLLKGGASAQTYANTREEPFNEK